MASSQHETAAGGSERKATRTNRSCAVQFMPSCLIYARPAANHRVMKNPSSQGIVVGIANAPSTFACDARLADITRIATSSPAAAPPVPKPQNAAATASSERGSAPEWPVGTVTRRFVPEGTYNWRGAATHALVTNLWYPAVPGTSVYEHDIGPPGSPLFHLGEWADDARAARGPFPLIALSHGTGGSAQIMAWLARGLASRLRCCCRQSSREQGARGVYR